MMLLGRAEIPTALEGITSFPGLHLRSYHQYALKLKEYRVGLELG